METYLQVRKAKVNPSVQLGHIKALPRGTAKYPIRRVDCKVFSIPQGTMSHTHENLYLGILPKRVFLFMIDIDAINGTYVKTPFNAKHNDINFVTLYVDGRHVPSKPLQPNFAQRRYMRSYINLFGTTGKTYEDEGNDQTRDDFGTGYTIFGFDLTPDCSDGDHFNLVHRGNLRAEVHFAAVLPRTVNVVVHGEFESVLEIDKNRNVVLDQ